MFGHNGSGKSTTIRTILGITPVLGGTIEFNGKNVTKANSWANVKAGMAMIPSERFVFADLSVMDNLLLGAANDPDVDRRAKRLELVRTLFPILHDRSAQLAGTMSGGQQRMVSLGMALMASPTLLMLDEPSLGLAPAVVKQIFATVRRLADEEGLAVLLLEQNVGQALPIVDRVLGHAIWSGHPGRDGRADAHSRIVLGPLLMPKMTTAEIDAFLDEPGHLLRVGTTDRDGYPSVVPIWFIRQGDDIVFTPRGPSLFLANIRSDPRVGLSIDEDPLPYRKITVRGIARIVHQPGNDDDWRDLYRQIAKRYVPAEAADAYVDDTVDQPSAPSSRCR